jgi:predicted nucleic acid-binding protein
MIGIDTNILLYSLNPASKFQAAAVEFLNEVFADRSQRVGITDYVLVELYNHLRNEAVLKNPLSPREAKEIVTSYWGVRNVTRIENAPVMDQVWEYAARPNFARRKIFDARLALTLQHHGVTEFATANVKDFKRLGFERVWNPLEKPRVAVDS